MSDEHAPRLDHQEEKKAEEEESLDANITWEVIRREGQKQLERTPSALAWSGLAAGLAMGFSLIAQGLLRHHIPEAGWRPLVVKLGYAIGFLIVILGSQQLFTENTLNPIVPLLKERSKAVLAKVARLWAVVLVANLVGAAIFAFVVARTLLLEPAMHATLTDIGREAIGWPEGHSFGTTFVRAIFAGWLIALMVWMLPAAQTAQVGVIILMTWLVGAGHLSHIIAGSVDVLYLVARGEIPLSTYLADFMTPTLLGNTLGGVALVAALNHAQVVAGGGKSTG